MLYSVEYIILQGDKTMLCKLCGVNEVSASKIKKRDYKCDKCHNERYKETHKRSYVERHANLRMQVFNHYGNECVYCGATEQLEIDHIEGNGKLHRAENNLHSGTKTYQYLVKENFPLGYQALCKRCNRAKGDMSDKEFRIWIDMLSERFHTMPL